MEKARFLLPEMFGAQSQFLAMNFQRNVRGLDIPTPLEDTSLVFSKMSEFAEEMNSGSITTLVKEYQKPKKQVPPGTFSIEPILTLEDPYLNDGYLTQYIDATYGFKLLYQKEEKGIPYWLAVTSFWSGSQITPDSFRYEILRKYENVHNPIIVQLQGNHKGDYVNRHERAIEAEEVIGTFRFERVLTKIDVAFFQKLQVPEAFLLPGELNPYYEKKIKPRPGESLEDIEQKKQKQKEIDEQLKLRYNSAAHHCGFKKHENGLYVYRFI